MSTCKQCNGRGVIKYPYKADELRKNPAVQTWVVSCACLKKQEELEELERIWRTLSEVDPVTSTKLAPHCKGAVPQDIVILSTAQDLKAHLGRLLRDLPDLRRQTRIVSDLDLVSAWLAHVDVIFDSEVSNHRDDPEDQYTRLVDIAGPSRLLIIQLGVKSARNVATPEVIMEAIRLRAHRGKATWIVEDPECPVQPGSISYSSQLFQILRELPQVDLGSTPRFVCPQNAQPERKAEESRSPPQTEDKTFQKTRPLQAEPKKKRLTFPKKESSEGKITRSGLAAHQV